MEQQIWSSVQTSLRTSFPPSLQSLTSLRSLITNPDTSPSNISSILETLTATLPLTASHPIAHRHVIKLLTDIASKRPNLSQSIFTSLLSISPPSASSLAALSSLSVTSLRIDDGLFLSLSFGSDVSLRIWLLNNAGRLRVRPSVLFPVFLGFTRDPFPSVREAALNGLVELCEGGEGFEEDRGVVEGCYLRAVVLLEDSEDYVRCAALRVVCEWGKLLVAAADLDHQSDWSDAVFLQLCSMARDMSVEVRVGAFYALRKMQTVSEDILLQTLSKKVLPVLKEKKCNVQCSKERFNVLVARAAGAFVHGIEDEFHEVRKSACHSLRTLVVLSAEFAGQALNLLVDMLNDDAISVRLEALEALHHMVIFDCLKIKEIHMHMFLGTLTDTNGDVRCALRKVLKALKLPNLKLLRMSINSLLDDLRLYPEDEADVFFTLFSIGQNHGNFVASIVKELLHEIEPLSEENMGIHTARVAALLVFAISAPPSPDHNDQMVPPHLFSYAVTLLGRISCALKDVMDQTSLLSYLSRRSRSSNSCNEDVGEKVLMQVINGKGSADGSVQGLLSEGISSLGSDKASQVQNLISCEPSSVPVSLSQYQLDQHNGIQDNLKFVWSKVKDVWPLVQSGCSNEVLKTLRVCKEELASFTCESLESDGAVVFTLQYLEVLELIAKLWEHFLLKDPSYEMGALEILLRRIDEELTEMRCRFVGLSKEEELHVVELVLLACILRLSKGEISSYCTTLQNLNAAIVLLESLQQESSGKLSTFAAEVKRAFHENGVSAGGNKELIKLFSIQGFNLCSKLMHIKANIDVCGNDSESPLPFVPGLPVAIPLEITLHNVSGHNRLWLVIKMFEQSTQYVYLDLNVLGGFEGNKFSFSAPFYRASKAVSFTLRVCIGMETLLEDTNLVKFCGGPKRPLTYLCKESVIYLMSTRV